MFNLFDPNSDFQIISGSNLPHWFQPQATYFITFRTADSLTSSDAYNEFTARGACLIPLNLMQKIITTLKMARIVPDVLLECPELFR